MRFPSIDLLGRRAAAAAERFPWTLLCGAAAAVFAIISVKAHGRSEDQLLRLTIVSALGLPTTIALALLGEWRFRSAAARLLLPLGGLVLLALFYLAWPGASAKHEVIRFLQLGAALHLAVAFLPFLGRRESTAFWQYNRRLFLGFLRAVVFSGVLYVGAIIALAALDHLFGLKIPSETYIRVWFVAAFVVNTWIFLTAVPEDLAGLEADTTYPRALQVFAQYVLTPLVFTYLLILLAYLVKLLAGAEWPSGWIGWLVTSVAVAGLLGFLLVHPLRQDPAEGWIRIYARWLFVGLIPAAVMLLVAFAKRIAPYGLTEPRLLGIILGVWLLGIAIWYTVRPGAGIRVIPVSLAIILLATLYGPISLSRISVQSQKDRLASLLPRARADRDTAREASSALRFLLEHQARTAVASALGQPLPQLDWDSAGRNYSYRDSTGARLLELVGVRYVPQYQPLEREGHFRLAARREPMALEGFDWLVPVSSSDTAVMVSGGDSVRVAFDTVTGVARIRIGRDTARFDLTHLVRSVPVDSTSPRGGITPALLTAETTTPRRTRLQLRTIYGSKTNDSLKVRGWEGVILVGE